MRFSNRNCRPSATNFFCFFFFSLNLNSPLCMLFAMYYSYSNIIIVKCKMCLVEYDISFYTLCIHKWIYSNRLGCNSNLLLFLHTNHFAINKIIYLHLSKQTHWLTDWRVRTMKSLEWSLFLLEEFFTWRILKWKYSKSFLNSVVIWSISDGIRFVIHSVRMKPNTKEFCLHIDFCMNVDLFLVKVSITMKIRVTEKGTNDYI